MLLLIIIIISLYRINNKINEIRTKIRENDEKKYKIVVLNLPNEIMKRKLLSSVAGIIIIISLVSPAYAESNSVAEESNEFYNSKCISND